MPMGYNTGSPCGLSKRPWHPVCAMAGGQNVASASFITVGFESIWRNLILTSRVPPLGPGPLICKP